MPPAISDDESDGELAVPIPTRGGRSSTSESKRGRSEDIAANGANGQDEQQDEEDDDEDMDEDEDEDEDVFEVEKIVTHMLDDDGSVKFKVKWFGWDAEEDMTWEPEDNLEGAASGILEKYYASIGGRERISEESSKASRGKKRGRPSTGAAAGGKRSRKSDHPSKRTPPASSKKWAPPAGSWEDEIDTIDAFEDEASGNGKLVVYLVWKNGNKTKHDTSVIYKKCPQKMLQFYERHVKIIKDENRALIDTAETNAGSF